MTTEYRAALIGLGNIAWRFDGGQPSGVTRTHLSAYRESGQMNVVCGYSPVAEDRREFEDECGIPACERINEIFDAKPDVVSICSPSDKHFEQTLTCLERAVPMIWLEKPPTLRLGELDTLIQHQAVRMGQSKVLVNYMRRYSRIYQHLVEVYQRCLLGKAVGMQVLYSRGLEANGSHFLDFVFLMRDDDAAPELIMPDSDRAIENPTFLLRFTDGFVVSFCGHSTPYHINDVILTCEEGRASVLAGGYETRMERKTENKQFSGFYRLGPADPESFGNSESDNSFGMALADLVDAHRSGRQPQSSLATARQTQALIEQIRYA
jgi:predicted dehydrogenase